MITFRFNSSFNPLTFLKLRFWPPKKKNYKTAPCICGSFGPKANFDSVTLSEMPRVVFLFLFFTKIGPWGPKLLQLQNLGGGFVVFFLRGPKSQLREN